MKNPRTAEQVAKLIEAGVEVDYVVVWESAFTRRGYRRPIPLRGTDRVRMFGPAANIKHLSKCMADDRAGYIVRRGYELVEVSG